MGMKSTFIQKGKDILNKMVNIKAVRVVRGIVGGGLRKLRHFSYDLSRTIIGLMGRKLDVWLFYVILLGILCMGVFGTYKGIKFYEYLKWRNFVIREITGIIEEAKRENYFMQVMIGNDEFVAFLYNKNGEAFAQSNQGMVAVYRKDDKQVAIGNTLRIDYGVSPLRLVELAVNQLKNFQAVAEVPDKSKDNRPDLESYSIRIKGKDNIHKLYAQVDKAYADRMVKQLFEVVDEEGEQLDPENTELVFTIVKGKNSELGGGCFIESNGKEYTSWYFDGYLKMFDWQLTEDWYSNDTSDTKKWQELVDKLVLEIDQKAKKYADENGIDLDAIGKEDNSGESGDAITEGTGQVSYEQ